MSPAPAIAAIVVCHDSGATLAECVQRLRVADGVAEIVLVDNGSRDGSVAALATADPRLSVRTLPHNPGYAVACNHGAAATRSPWLVFLNPDCFVPPDALVRLVAHAAADPGIGLLGADVRDSTGHPEPAARRREPTWRRALGRVLGAEGADGLHAPPAPPGVVVHPVDAVSGALMLMPRAVFERVGGFDVGYRLHCEDLDLCRRVRDAGFRVAVAEDVPVTHVKGSSSARRPLFVAWHKHRGMARYFARHQARSLPLPLRLAVPVGIWARFALQLPLLIWRAWRARG